MKLNYSFLDSNFNNDVHFSIVPNLIENLDEEETNTNENLSSIGKLCGISSPPEWCNSSDSGINELKKEAAIDLIDNCNYSPEQSTQIIDLADSFDVTQRPPDVLFKILGPEAEEDYNNGIPPMCLGRVVRTLQEQMETIEAAQSNVDINQQAKNMLKEQIENKLVSECNLAQPDAETATSIVINIYTNQNVKDSLTPEIYLPMLSVEGTKMITAIKVLNQNINEQCVMDKIIEYYYKLYKIDKPEFEIPDTKIQVNTESQTPQTSIPIPSESTISEESIDIVEEELKEEQPEDEASGISSFYVIVIVLIILYLMNKL